METLETAVLLLTTLVLLKLTNDRAHVQHQDSHLTVFTTEAPTILMCIAEGWFIKLSLNIKDFLLNILGKQRCYKRKLSRFYLFPSSKSETSRNDVIILSSTCTSSSSNLYPYYLTQEANPPQILQCHRTDLIFLYCGNLFLIFV